MPFRPFSRPAFDLQVECTTRGRSGGRRFRPWAAFVAGLCCAVVLGGLVGPAAAQYSAPGTSTPSDEMPTEKSLEENIEAAPWQTGGLRILPWAGFRDVALVRIQDESGDEADDFTATFGAGVRAYLPVGGKVYWAAHALPEYVWWSDQDSKRRTNGRYGLGMFGYFNRLKVEASYRLDETQRFFSNEIQELTTTQQLVTRLGAEVKLGARLSVFALGERFEQENQEDDNPQFALLDRDEEKVSAGVRYRAPRGWMVGLGYEDNDVEFEAGARNLSNTQTATRFELGFEGNRLDAIILLRALEQEPEVASDFRPVDETLGNVDLLWNLSERVAMLTYARRDVFYSLDADQSHYLGERFGGRLDFDLRKAVLGAFVELGEDDYVPLGAQTPRLDDVTTFGAFLDFQFRDLLVVSVQLRETQYDSNFEIFDRDVTNLGLSVELGSLLRRLNLGGGGGQW